MNRMKKLKEERLSQEQLKIRTDLMVHELKSFDFIIIGNSLEFKTQKAAREAWKYIKPKIESRFNQMKIIDLSKKEFLNGVLDKKQIKII